MNRKNWQKIKEIFNDALEIESMKRASFLDEACGGDEDLRREVEILLESFADDFLEKPAVGQVADAVIAEAGSAFETGDLIGNYRIVKELGMGGQGAVFLAEDLQLARRVAIKFLPLETSADALASRRFLREARAAAPLSHPNICEIHKIETDAPRQFIVMQYVEGETLAARLKRGSPDLNEALDIAIQIAYALSAAHLYGIIHRDIKPANIIVSEDNRATVLDFGLAKRSAPLLPFEDGEHSSMTEPGTIMGTASYMSPEQARAEKPDFRTDIWSLGVCLYEMTAGKNPFFHTSLAETFAAILTFEPDFSAVPPPVAAIIRKALRKNPAERYATAEDIFRDLRELRNKLNFKEMLISHEKFGTVGGRVEDETDKTKPPKGATRNFIFAILLLIALAVGGWFYRQNRNLSWARENVKTVESLAKADKTFEAYDLASEIRQYLPDDESLQSSMPIISDSLSVRTEPAGARVYLQRFQPTADGKFPERVPVGETPLENLPIARGQYLLSVEKAGYAPFTRSVSDRLPDYSTDLIAIPPLEIEAKLIEKEKLPARMVFVLGGEYRLVSYSRPTGKTVPLDDFYIDKYEVSNAEFKEFITAGGYSKKEFWQLPLTENGKEIPFEEAVKSFTDRTGLSAPRSWTNQNPPENQGNFPVTDITWLEAAAYAKFRGKRLPTVFQWEKAARDGKFDEGWNTMPWGLSRAADASDLLANFRGTNPSPVESFEFGASPYGCLNMAGNVAEWLLNRRGENALVSGGAFGEKSYLFGYYGDFPLRYSSPKIGFRLVVNSSPDTAGAEDLPPVEIPVYARSSAADFKKWLVHYAYDKTPTDAEIVERTETDAWTREKIAFTGANRERAAAYLYLPKNAPRPLQVVHWIPAADVPLGFSSITHSVEDFLAPVIKRGRAVFAVVAKGYNERPRAAGYEAPEETSVEFRKETVEKVTDWRRGLDYLETRDDLNRDRIAFLGLSSGANQGLILTAIETRYHSVAFVGFGVRPAWMKWIPEANLINFSPHIAAPKLILKGRYDEAHPLKTEAEPLFQLLGEPRRIVIVESGHVPPPEIFAPAVNDWLDETLGKVFQ